MTEDDFYEEDEPLEDIERAAREGVPVVTKKPPSPPLEGELSTGKSETYAPNGDCQHVCKSGRVPLCRHCDEPLVQKDSQDYWTHAHSLYRCQQKVTYGHNAAHPDVPCASLGPINRCACLR